MQPERLRQSPRNSGHIPNSGTTTFLRGSIRVLEPWYDGLLVQFVLECEDRTVSGREVFRVEGRARHNLWPYLSERPSKGIIEGFIDTMSYAWEGL